MRRAAAVAGPGASAGDQRADRPAAPGSGHGRAVRDARDQPDPAVRGPGAVPGRRAVPERQAGGGDDHAGAVGAVSGAGAGGQPGRPVARRGRAPRGVGGRTASRTPGGGLVAKGGDVELTIDLLALAVVETARPRQALVGVVPGVVV